MVLALRLWLVLHSPVVVPRESVSLMAVAGSGKYEADHNPQSALRRRPWVSFALCAHGILGVVVSLRHRNQPAARH